jgi:uracil-DNA glycosylase family 4
MSKGFFPASTVTKPPPMSMVAKCGACGLYKDCKSPKMPPSGEGRRKILIVGEAPGADEDDDGIQFVGKAGQFLQDELSMLGVDLRKDCWITNALICRPPDNKIDDDEKIDHCRPNLIKTIQELKPRVVILLGLSAVRSLVGYAWKRATSGENGEYKVGSLGRWVGWTVPSTEPTAWICPTYHPSYLLRVHDKVLDNVFRKHLTRAFELADKRPWEELPNYEAQVEVILDTDKAAAIIRKMIEKGGPVAVDYENNTLKPETPRARTLCCSVCWRGKKTIAYPWHGEAIKATGELLASERVYKIASNLKHENRWTLKEFGFLVRRWLHDTMVAAHVLDNREGGICGLKFQAFVQLGAQSYDDHISEFLTSHSNTKLNTAASEVDLRQLLTYCGCDTLLEYLLAEHQMRLLGRSMP